MDPEGDTALEMLARTVRESGLAGEGTRGVAMLSGGPDSACLAAGLVVLLGPGSVSAVHVNYGLRPDSGRDEAAFLELCERLGIESRVAAVSLDAAAGNVQSAARDARYGAAEELRATTGGDWIATGHTRTDLAETVIYRLATSPGRRALLGLPARRGRIVRPLLALGREDTRRLALAASLPFHDDPSNRDPKFARARIRAEVLPVLRDLGPAAEQTIAATHAELTEEAEALEAIAAEALDAAGATTGAVGESAVVSAEGLEPLPAAIRRLALRTLAERVAGRPVALGSDLAAEVLLLAAQPEGGEADLGGGLTAQCESGLVRIIAPRAAEELVPATLPVPGTARFGSWELRAEHVDPAPEVGLHGEDTALFALGAVGAELEVRAWEEGDRIRPLGMSGHKTLQDLFTDKRIPRSLRRTLPVVVKNGTVAWVAGVALSEEFRLAAPAEAAVLVTATRVSK